MFRIDVEPREATLPRRGQPLLHDRQQARQVLLRPGLAGGRSCLLSLLPEEVVQNLVDEVAASGGVHHFALLRLLYRVQAEQGAAEVAITADSVLLQ